MSLLAVKFLYFPLVYALFISRRNVAVTPRIPTGIVLFLCWGVLISLLHALQYPLTAGFGMAVNLTFVPIAVVAGGAYRTKQDVARALYRLAVFGALVGVLSLYQSTLPSNHWLNRGMDLSDRIEERVTGTFPFCTVLGNFVMGGTIAGLATITLATKKSTKLLFGFGWLALEIGGLFSGSRAGSLGSAIILVLVLTLSTKRIKRAAQIAFLILVAVAANTFGILQIGSTKSSRRAVATEDVQGRVQQDYVGGNLGDAFGVTSGLGTGWGPYTMGISVYGERLGFKETPPSTALEGGYTYILAETGVIGLLLFLCMHSSFASGLRSQGTLRWLGPAIAVWSLLGNLPLCLQEVPVLAVAWWFLTGLYWSTLRQDESSRVLRWRARSPGHGY